jgi:hypothetical protein
VLKAADMTWEDIWQLTFYGAANLVDATYKVTIRNALETLLEVMPRGKFRDIIASFDRQYEANGYLSEKQRAVLRKAWQQHTPFLKERAFDF